MTQATMDATERLAGAPERASVVRASERLWNLRWPTRQFGTTSISPATFSDAASFVAEHYPKIFPSQPGLWLEEKMTAAKRRFLEESDVLLFRDEGRIIGICVCNPVDWATYYIRTLAILPEHRRRNIVDELGVLFDETLRCAGVERIEAETAPSNVVMNRFFLGHGWMVTATVNSERWGTLLRYTKFLTSESERTFRRQFLVTAEQDVTS